MALLVLDRDREQKKDFRWYMPIDAARRDGWVQLAKKYELHTPEEYCSVNFLLLDIAREVKLILLPEGGHTTQDVEHAGAYLRMVKGCTYDIWVLEPAEWQEGK